MEQGIAFWWIPRSNKVLIMEINKQIYEFVKEAGIRNYPNEACGLIYAKGKKAIPVECKNVSLEPEHNFIISAEDYASTMSLGEIVGCWHTHCNTDARPSDADKQACENTETTWYIGSVRKNDAGEVYFDGMQVLTPTGFMMPLVGRPYAYGVFDCFTILRDYYKTEFNIELPDCARIEDPWDTDPDFCYHRALACGFERTGGQPKKGDIFLIQTGTEGADHVAVYIGDDKILHHMRNRLSRHDIYGGSYWQMHTLSHWRHKDVD